MDLQHLIDCHSISCGQIEAWVQQAKQVLHHPHTNCLQGKTLVNLFFEPSTRTCNSFSLAAMRQGMDVLNPNLVFSALQKGETRLDTLQTFAAMGVDVMVLRHAVTGFAREALSALDRWPDLHVINAGDGVGHHPTQALADILTIEQALHSGHTASAQPYDWTRLQVSIVGDIRHSRVANSLISLLHILGGRTN